VTAQELAASVHVTGSQVAKAVVVEADGKPWIVVLPATAIIDRSRLAQALAARQVRLMGEAEFARFFPDCELGAEPPFGGLYGLPVAVELSLAGEPRLVVRAGSHEEALEIGYADFARLERPHVAAFGAALPSVAQPLEEGRTM
jgi:Ala-tRNA(Pro) deacylase